MSGFTYLAAPLTYIAFVLIALGICGAALPRNHPWVPVFIVLTYTGVGMLTISLVWSWL